MKSNRALFIAIPVILIVVLLMTYLQFFTSTELIVVIFALYIGVSLLNRRKFRRQQVHPNQK